MDEGLKQKTAAEEIRFDCRDAAVMLLAEIFVFNRSLANMAGIGSVFEHVGPLLALFGLLLLLYWGLIKKPQLMHSSIWVKAIKEDKAVRIFWLLECVLVISCLRYL